MNVKHTTRMSLVEAQTRKTETDWDRVRADSEAEPDQDDIEVDWESLKVVEPTPKKMISLRVDRDVLEFFQRSGKGYQTRINSVLRAYKDVHERS